MKFVLSVSLILLTSISGYAKPDIKSIDPKGVDLLKRMVRSYRDIRSLDQTCITADGEGAAQKGTKSHLMVQKPNLFLYEIEEAIGGTDKSLRTIVQSDGKDLYSYNPRSGNYFSKAKAPRGFDGFRSNASTLELAAMTGMDVIEPFLKQASEIKLGADETVENVPCKSVLLVIWDGARKGEINMLLGAKDNLIRRFIYTLTFDPSKLPPVRAQKAIETQPLPTKTSIRPLCRLDDPQPEGPKVMSKTSYTNTVIVNPPLPKGTFTWIAPVGAMEFQGMGGIQPLSQYTRNGRSAIKAGPKAKQPKIITWEELNRNARRPDQVPKQNNQLPRP